MRRRALLQLAALTPLLAALPGRASPRGSERTLVLLELQGGNDGLNTVVPYADPEYYRLRPTLGVARDSVLPLDERLGLNPALAPLLPAWQAGELAWVLGVGYPEPNLSHFRSIEIWETGADSDEYLDAGWVSRTLPEREGRDGLPDAVVLGREGIGALQGAGLETAVISDPDRFAAAAARMPVLPSDAAHSGALGHILRVQRELHRAGETLRRLLARSPAAATEATLPAGPLAAPFRQLVRLLARGAWVPVIKVSLVGFDTHVNQRPAQDRLLRHLAESLAGLREALIARSLWDRVLVLSYSEFGRRAAENANRGTDHGTAAPHFALGGRVRGGLHGRQPALTELANGNLLHHVDFRSLYATVARRWWHASRDPFSARHRPFDFLGG